MTEDNIFELGHRSIEFIQPEQQRGNRKKQNQNTSSGN